MAKRKAPGAVIDAPLAIESVPIDSLKPHPRNIRQGDLGAVIESVKANGCYRPLIVQRGTRHILAGNHLWRALQSLGRQNVDAVFIDCDDARALNIMLADNRTADLGTYDNAGLAELLQGIMSDTGTLLGTGYDGDALDEIIADLGRAPEALFPELPSGDKAPFQQMTFTLHDEQAEQVTRALAAAKGMGPYVDSPNENSNGNALARVCETFLTEHAHG